MKALGPEKLRTGRSHWVIPGASKVPASQGSFCLSGNGLPPPSTIKARVKAQCWLLNSRPLSDRCLVMLNTACCVSSLPDGGTCSVLQLGERQGKSLASSGSVMPAQNFCSPVAVSNIQLPLFSVSASPQPPKMSQLPAAGSRRFLLVV